MSNDCDWEIECSDEEYKDVKGPWEPNPNIIDHLYNILDRGEIPEIEWKCPGYRSPSPEPEEEKEVNLPKESDNKSDFEFMDEMQTPKLKIRKQGEETLKGSAKKKTTSLDAVLNNMRRHNLLPSKTNS